MFGPPEAMIARLLHVPLPRSMEGKHCRSRLLHLDTWSYRWRHWPLGSLFPAMAIVHVFRCILKKLRAPKPPGSARRSDGRPPLFSGHRRPGWGLLGSCRGALGAAYGRSLRTSSRGGDWVAIDRGHSSFCLSSTSCHHVQKFSVWGGNLVCIRHWRIPCQVAVRKGKTLQSPHHGVWHVLLHQSWDLKQRYFFIDSIAPHK